MALNGSRCILGGVRDGQIGAEKEILELTLGALGWVKVMAKTANRSRKAARYGALAERAARERYDLEPDHDGMHDAITADGRPVEIKAAMLNRRSGPSRFRIFRSYHEELVGAGGVYVFVAYAARGRGIQVRKMCSREADTIQVRRWSSSGGHRGSEQRRIPVGAIF